MGKEGHTKLIPRKGWRCVGASDSGGQTCTEIGYRMCEMCETRGVKRTKYMHTMDHPRYKNKIDVCTMCASDMEDNPAAAKNRETAMKSTKQNFQTTPCKWKTSRKGNQSTCIGKHRATVFPRFGQWSFVINNCGTGNNMFAEFGNTYRNMEVAKLAASKRLTEIS